MEFFKRASLKAKMLAGNSPTLILLLILSVISYRNIGFLLDSNVWVSHTYNVIASAKSIEAAAVDMETGMRGFLLAGKEDFLAPYNNGQKRFYEEIKALQKTVDDNPAQVKLLDEIRETISEWQDKVTEPAIALRREVGVSKSMDDIAALVGEARGKQYFDKFRGQIATFAQRESDLMQSRKELAGQTANNTLKSILFGTIIIITLSMVISWLLSRVISVPLSLLAISLKEGAEQVTAAADQVSGSSQSLAEGATEQAAAIEESSASMEEMNSMTMQNADNATRADGLMNETSRVVATAEKSMGDMSNAMEEISKASQETSNIIKTIDEIAFQTNLLALNAAVEAARAGEAGAGFAVVADEVRNLAMRAAEAAKKTSELIEGTVTKVGSGKEIVSKTNVVFKNVTESSSKVGTLIGEITLASKEQATGFKQISQAITQIETVTQQNTAYAEESASAAEQLNAQAASMMEAVNRLSALIEGASRRAGRAERALVIQS